MIENGIKGYVIRTKEINGVGGFTVTSISNYTFFLSLRKLQARYGSLGAKSMG